MDAPLEDSPTHFPGTLDHIVQFLHTEGATERRMPLPPLQHTPHTPTILHCSASCFEQHLARRHTAGGCSQFLAPLCLSNMPATFELLPPPWHCRLRMCNVFGILNCHLYQRTTHQDEVLEWRRVLGLHV